MKWVVIIFKRSGSHVLIVQLSVDFFDAEIQDLSDRLGWGGGALTATPTSFISYFTPSK
jgi:hypothetical protein